jgi:hypothetical protein
MSSLAPSSMSFYSITAPCKRYAGIRCTHLSNLAALPNFVDYIINPKLLAIFFISNAVFSCYALLTDAEISLILPQFSFRFPYRRFSIRCRIRFWFKIYWGTLSLFLFRFTFGLFLIISFFIYIILFELPLSCKAITFPKYSYMKVVRLCIFKH